MATDQEQLRRDIVLFANDLAEHHATPAGRAVIDAFYASAWGDYDMPESIALAEEMGALPSAEAARLVTLLEEYWSARNA